MGKRLDQPRFDGDRWYPVVPTIKKHWNEVFFMRRKQGVSPITIKPWRALAFLILPEHSLYTLCMTMNNRHFHSYVPVWYQHWRSLQYWNTPIAKRNFWLHPWPAGCDPESHMVPIECPILLQTTSVRRGSRFLGGSIQDSLDRALYRDLWDVGRNQLVMDAVYKVKSIFWHWVCILQ